MALLVRCESLEWLSRVFHKSTTTMLMMSLWHCWGYWCWGLSLRSRGLWWLLHIEKFWVQVLLLKTTILKRGSKSFARARQLFCSWQTSHSIVWAGLQPVVRPFLMSFGYSSLVWLFSISWSLGSPWKLTPFPPLPFHHGLVERPKIPRHWFI